MPEYLCLQRTLATCHGEAAELSPSSRSAAYAQLNRWREKFGSNVVDMGGRLGVARTVLPDSESDTAVARVRELIGGYMIISATDIDEALRVARELPGLVHAGSGVEVIEIRLSR